MPRFGSRLVLLCAMLSACPPAAALESDQYYAWGRELDDATDLLNAKVRLEIDRVLTGVNARGSRPKCEKVAKRIGLHFKQMIFHEIEIWAANSSLVPRIPATAEEELTFTDRYILRHTHLLDYGTKVPPSPTIELNGVRLGTDKLSHFFSEGYWYYRWYRNKRGSKRTPEELERWILRRGIVWERTILGLLSSGIFSPGDLEANYQGLQFFIGLCEGDSPGLVEDEAGWRYVGKFDFRDYVTPEWDESYQPVVFGRRRWKKVRPALRERCPMLTDPWVVEQRRAYALADRVTPTERILQELIDAGRLRDPREFSLEANCDEQDIRGD
jgi:hypothetical protein